MSMCFTKRMMERNKKISSEETGLDGNTGLLKKFHSQNSHNS